MSGLLLLAVEAQHCWTWWQHCGIYFRVVPPTGKEAEMHRSPMPTPHWVFLAFPQARSLRQRQPSSKHSANCATGSCLQIWEECWVAMVGHRQSPQSPPVSARVGKMAAFSGSPAWTHTSVALVATLCCNDLSCTRHIFVESLARLKNKIRFDCCPCGGNSK